MIPVINIAPCEPKFLNTDNCVLSSEFKVIEADNEPYGIFTTEYATLNNKYVANAQIILP